MPGPTGPNDLPEQNKEQDVKLVIRGFEILHCKTCKKDVLFARVENSNSGQKHLFCTRCGEYTEVFDVWKN